MLTAQDSVQGEIDSLEKKTAEVVGANDTESGLVDMSKVRHRLSAVHIHEPKQSSPVDTKPSSRTLDWQDIPSWQQDNKFILTGYRRVTHSYQKAAASMSYLHNQTGNIYSHLLATPTLILAAYMTYVIQNLPREPIDNLILSIFILGASTCFALSTAFHTFACHSAMVEEYWVRLDFVGIITITATTFVAGEYYLFFCEHVRMGVHMTLTVSLAVLTVVVLLTPKFQGPTFRSFRLACFCLMGVSGFVPMIDCLWHYGWSYSKRYSIGYYLIEMLLELLGAATYGCRIPERFAPGKFDIWGHSHQWFHLFSAGAALVHLAGLAHALHNTRATSRCIGRPS